MNGNSDTNFNEAGNTGAYAGTPGDSASAGAHTYAGQAAGTYNPESNAAGANYTHPGADPYAASGYVPPPPGYIPPYGAPVPPPPIPGAPNPGLAALLGFIPGVGAMYNGQFAKGIAHIVIFSILTSLSSHAHDPLDVIFGLLVAGWYFYMVFDAYQTARARRDGLVAPDPFGLNNIGERFGMPHNPNWGDFVARPAANGSAASADSARTSNPYAGPAVDPAVTANTQGYAARDPQAAAAAYGGYPYSPGYTYPPPVPPAGYPAGTVPPPWQPSYPEAYRTQPTPDVGGTAPYAAYQPAYPAYDPAAMPPVLPQTNSGIPTGAFWLIGLGILALIGSLAHNVYWSGRYLGGLVPILFGIFLIVQRALAARKLYPVGSAAHSWYIIHQARFGVLLIVVGGLTLLSSVGILYWSHSWPYLLILFGLMQVADRAAYNRMLAETPAPPMPRYDTPAQAATAATDTPGATTTEAKSNSGFTSIFGQEGR